MLSAQRTSAKSGIVLCRREQHSLRLEHRHRRRLRDRQLALDRLARRPQISQGPQIIGDLLRRRAAAGHFFDAGDDAVELAGVARQPFGENLQIGDGVLQRLRIFGSARNRPCATRRGPPASCSAPAPGSAISVGTSPEFASSMPPSSAITGTPVRPWNSRPTLVSDRTGVVEATEIVALTRRGLSGASPRSRHLADADSIEQHGGADQEPGHRAIELDVIGRARTEPAGIVEPVDEAEYGGDGRQHEGADNDEGSAGFHLFSSLWVAASGSACRGNRPAPRDARIEAVRASVRWRRSCRPPAPRRDRRRYSGWRGHG